MNLCNLLLNPFILQNLTMAHVKKKVLFSSVSSLPFGIVSGMSSTSYTERS